VIWSAPLPPPTIQIAREQRQIRLHPPGRPLSTHLLAHGGDTQRAQHPLAAFRVTALGVCVRHGGRLDLLQDGAQVLRFLVTVWSRRWIAEAESNVGRYGIQRMVRDVFPISGTLRLAASGVVEAVQLNALHPLARGVADGLAGLLRPAQVAVTTGVV
jgi:hypothetical protein